ncbi:uncharacterized protein LOC115065965 [Bactrocera dorsalis]|uniref:Uncharacterized protein LOC115065965 n=1 Tax=Bactrocera dorsalis TaxID=27457 RepID=A0ABM3K4L8_BACDO|nr:uncharacterized protein LOC115065965 [Bactrocera dorsalis]XP_049316424.1 uncharacterized protein LOC115065965 [Bactrocera dorsalis]XP_049316425.1 uncharacterized protein LOC115065965 [Bactrocera dorsalis]
MEAQIILNMTVPVLKDKLREVGLPITGRKKDLRDRLLTFHGLLNDDDESDSEVETARSRCESVSSRVQELPSAHHFSFRDIEESLTLFNGTDSHGVNQWVQSFEENAQTVGWSNVQKFIYAKQLLRGAAKSFVRSQVGILDWVSLKRSLIKEFGATISASEVHSRLSNRRKGQNESYLEFLYALMEIGSQVGLDEISLLAYFIQGIPDSKFNKAVLYQAKNIDELKDQIKIYEKIRSRVGSVKTENPKEEVEVNNQSQGLNRACFKCGDTSHIARNCPSQQFRCYKCSKMGHKAYSCPNVKIKTEVDKSNLNVVNEIEFTPSAGDFELKFKDIRVGNTIFPALIDTGSQLCLIRADIVNKLSLSFKPNNDIRVLRGIGQSETVTVGSFETKAQLDNVEVSIVFHIIREEDMNYPAIIGRSILSEVDLIVTKDKDIFKYKNESQKSEYIEINDENDMEGTKPEPWEFASIGLHVEELKYNDREAPTYDLAHLDEHSKEEVEMLIGQYEPKRLKFSPIEMKIIVKDDIPVHQPPRRVSFQDQKFINEQIKQWLEAGIITPSVSNYASPIVLVSNKAGSKRLCCDYRKLNEKIIRDNFPMSCFLCGREAPGF